MTGVDQYADIGGSQDSIIITMNQNNRDSFMVYLL